MQFLLRGCQLVLQLWNASVLNLRGGVQISRPLRLLHLQLRRFELFVQNADCVDGRLFVLPPGFEFRGLLLQIGQRFFQLLQTLARRLVFLLLQSGLLDLQLHNLAFKPVDFRRHRIQFHAQARRRLVHKVHRLVRQKTVGDVAMRQGGGRHERGVLNAHAVVHFVAFLQTPQNRDGRLHARLRDVNGLEPPFQRRVFFDVLAIFIERRRADATEFAARQLRFEHVRRVGRAFGRAGADQSVQFVDKQNDASFTGGDFL